MKRPALDFDPRQNIYDRLFVYLLIASFILRILWLDKPDGSLIFDEKFYVNVARNILHLPHDPSVYPEATLGLDPNHEHPFLGKGIIALSMLILGDNAWGWRIPSVLFGTIALFVFYLLVKKLSNRNELALVSSFLFAFSNLIFVHSRIATLDIFMLTFMLLGFYWYFTGRTYLSAISLALATLSKLGGIYGFLSIVIFHYAKILIKEWKQREGLDWRELLKFFEKYALTYIIFGLVLLIIFDRIWVGYNNPLDHIAFIYKHTVSLRRAVPEGIASYPWQWLFNEVKIPYLKVNVDVRANGKLIRSSTSVLFQGAMNPLIIFLTIPAMAYALFNTCKRKDQTSLFTIIWFVTTYLPFYPMSIIGHRIMYLFYFLPTIPSVSIAISSLFLSREKKPFRMLLLVYLIAVLVGFVMLFPFKQVP